MSMTLKDISDLFRAEYKLECSKRQVPESVLPEQYVAALIAEAQNEIAAEMNAAEGLQVITATMGNTTTSYNLNPDVGVIKSVWDGTSYYTLVDWTQLQEDAANGITYEYTVVNSSNGYKILFSTAPQASVIITYYQMFGLYSPSGGSNQTWGTFDGQVYTGSLQISDRYIPALRYYMLSRIFPDFLVLYQDQVNKLKNRRPFKPVSQRKYNLL